MWTKRKRPNKLSFGMPVVLQRVSIERAT